MKHRIHSLLVGAMGLASAAFFVFAGASCEQPTIQCVAGHGPFFATYTLVSGDESCYGIKGEDIGLSTFLAPNADKTLANYDDRSIAIKSTTLGELVDARDGAGYDRQTDKPYAFGKYTTAPDANNLCYAGGGEGTAALVPAEMDIEAFDTGELDPDTMMPIILPATHVRQEWSNVKVYVTAGVPGTQAVGRMRFEDVTNNCSAEYTFVGLFPSVYCGAEVHIDDDNDPATPAENDDANPDEDDENTMTVVDEDACLPEADPSKGRVYGSGINPDFSTRCHPELFHCVLTGDPLTGNP